MKASCPVTCPFPHVWLLLQYMNGGDLGVAIDDDVTYTQRGDGQKRRLGWYGSGANVLWCVARGLAYLHSKRVRLEMLARCCWYQYMLYKHSQCLSQGMTIP